MKISIITTTFNSGKYIESCLNSIASQTYKNIEHIVIDGNSSDDTLQKINEHNWIPSKVISEPDLGIYDAMNKGFNLSNGDVIAYLNSDDFYCNKFVLEKVASIFLKLESVDYVYGNVNFINEENLIVRRWITGNIHDKIKDAQIPHMALFCKKSILEKLDQPFDTNYPICADQKQQIILINKFKAKGKYINETFTHLKVGGKSTENLNAYFNGWIEAYKIYNEVMGSGGLWYTWMKVYRKLKGLSFFRYFLTKR